MGIFNLKMIYQITVFPHFAFLGLYGYNFGLIKNIGREVSFGCFLYNPLKVLNLN